MADRGLVGRPARTTRSGMPFPQFAVGGIKAAIDQDATVSGTALVGGVPVAGIHVFLMWRPSMYTFAHTVSAADGTFTFTDVPRSGSNIVVYFQDAAGGTAYNDIVFASVSTA